VTLPFDAHGRPMCTQAAQAGGGLVASESSLQSRIWICVHWLLTYLHTQLSRSNSSAI
jgi:hypothetical protein